MKRRARILFLLFLFAFMLVFAEHAMATAFSSSSAEVALTDIILVGDIGIDWGIELSWDDYNEVDHAVFARAANSSGEDTVDYSHDMNLASASVSFAQAESRILSNVAVYGSSSAASTSPGYNSSSSGSQTGWWWPYAVTGDEGTIGSISLNFEYSIILESFASTPDDHSTSTAFVMVEFTKRNTEDTGFSDGAVYSESIQLNSPNYKKESFTGVLSASLDLTAGQSGWAFMHIGTEDYATTEAGPTQTPIPPTLLLLGTGLISLAVFHNRKLIQKR